MALYAPLQKRTAAEIKIVDGNGHIRTRSFESIPEAKYNVQPLRTSHQFLMTQTEITRGMMEMNFTFTRLTDRDGEFRIPAGARDFLLSKTVQTGSDAHPVFQSMGAGALSPRVKRPEREVDCLPLPSAEANNEWIYNPAPLICLHGVERDNCNFHF
jgi:hypothetical protein